MGSRVEMLKHWFRISRGDSYWTSSSAGEPDYEAGSLSLYYRDYTGKAHWEGECDADGLPLVRVAGAPAFHHPLLIAQKALGHWNLAARRGDGPHLASFLAVARWLRDAQGQDGGWVIPTMKRDCYASPVSALAQGQAVSVLVRAGSLDGDGSFMASARRGLSLMLRRVDDGGTARREGTDLVLEEYPRVDGPHVVLNGWVSAIYGLVDYSAADAGDAEIADALRASVDTLSRRVSGYDAGYWSYYDGRGTIASPYYHRVHIVQLDALAKTFTDQAEEFARIARRFDAYRRSAPKRTRAVAWKVVQKLRTPPETVLVESRGRGGNG